MPLHPEARALLDQIAAAGIPPIYEQTVPEARAGTAALVELVGPGPELPNVAELEVPTSAGAIPGRLYEPEDPAASILWIHGGGWVICDLETHDAMCRLLAKSSGCRVIAIDYRLAPEHPFPAPLEDAWDALRWVAGAYGDQPVIVAGDSAGGNMAAVCALRARDRGGPELAMQILVYPATDATCDKPSHTEHGAGPDLFLTFADMEWFTGHYLPDRSLVTNPEVSPLRAADHGGLPRAIVITAEYDPLRDDGKLYAERLRQSGVTVSEHHYEDMIHAFFGFVNLFATGTEAVERTGAEIRAALAELAVPA